MGAASVSRSTPEAIDAEGEPLPEIPGYDLIEEIGRGGMGVVYEGYQRSTGRRVAVKFMRGSGRDLSLRFEREIDLLARLSHPGIVSVIDSGATAGRYYYVMEYVEGRPLDQHLSPGSSEPRSVLKLLADIADVVNDAHQRGVLHRDLKPANILVESNGRIRLLDFGLAKAIDPDTGVNAELTISEAGRPMGTLAYMPPEQAAGGSKGISVRSDVYALGVIGYYLLTGHHPIDVDGKLLDVIKRIQQEQPDRPSSIRNGLGPDIDAIIGKATSKLPQDRYATASELAADIRRYLAGLPITARELPRSVRAWRWTRRHRVPVGILAACVALLATMGWVAVARIIGERDRANALLLETFSQFRQVDGMEDLARQRIQSAKQLYGAGSRFHAIAIIQLGLILERFQRNVEAELHLMEGLEMVRKLDRASPSDISIACLHHGRVLVWIGRLDEARAALEESVAIASRYGPAAEQTLAQARLFLGLSWTMAGKYTEAEPYLRDAYTWWAVDPAARDDGYYAGGVRTYADCLLKLGRADEAERVLIEALEREEQVISQDVSRRLRLTETLASFYIAVNRTEDAAKYADLFRTLVKSSGAPAVQETRMPQFSEE